MSNTIMVLDRDRRRRRALRRALERRGFRVEGEAGSSQGFVIATAQLDRAPDTVLVGASVGPDVAPLVKRAFPAANVIEEVRRPRLRVAASG